MLRKSFLAFIAILFLFDCFVLVFFLSVFCFVLFFSFFIQKTLSAKVKTMKLVKTTMRRPLYRW